MNRQIVDTRLRLDPDLQFARPELAELLTLWREKCAGRAMPDRADLTPFTLQSYLPRILIYEPVEEPPLRRFRIRLYGTLVSRSSGRDMTGKFVDEILPPEIYADFARGLNWIVDHGKPLRATGTYHFLDRSFVHFESLNMPVTAGRAHMIQIISVNYYGGGMDA